VNDDDGGERAAALRNVGVHSKTLTAGLAEFYVFIRLTHTDSSKCGNEED
jgi:hypothetical protein